MTSHCSPTGGASVDFFHSGSRSPEWAQHHSHHLLLVKTDSRSRPTQTQGECRSGLRISRGRGTYKHGRKVLMTDIFEVKLMHIFLFLYHVFPISSQDVTCFPSLPCHSGMTLFFFEGTVTEDVHHSFVGFQLRHETCPLQ